MFTESVFYVGKGKNSRSLQHLKDARSCDKLPPAKVSKPSVEPETKDTLSSNGHFPRSQILTVL